MSVNVNLNGIHQLTLDFDGTTTADVTAPGVVTVTNDSFAITQLTGDVIAGPGYGSLAATVVGVNGASVPASHAYVGTNSSSQIIAATTPLLPANNLSDVASAATSRTNLGLGTMATQNATTVAITGGTVNGTTIGATTPSTGAFTSITSTGGLVATNSSVTARGLCSTNIDPSRGNVTELADQTTVIGWNLESGTGDASFVNVCSTALQGGFNFYKTTAGVAPTTPLMRLDKNGNLSVVASVSGTTLAGTNTTGTVLTLGHTAGSGTPVTNPVAINMGDSYSSTAGANPKIVLYNNALPIGIGISSGSMDYINSAGATGKGHAFYVNGSKIVVIDPTSLAVNGSFTATTKSFTIVNPLDNTKLLVHGCLEGPEHGAYYRGQGQLVNGIATIKLPDYFESLVADDNRTVLLTPIFTSTEAISNLAASVVTNGQFSVRSIDQTNVSQPFYWEVKAYRKDIPALDVEPDVPVQTAHDTLMT